MRQGKALYIRLSTTTGANRGHACRTGTPGRCRCLIHQMRYSMLAREPENGLLSLSRPWGGQHRVFAAGAGLLTAKYLGGIPAESPHGRGGGSRRRI